MNDIEAIYENQKQLRAGFSAAAAQIKKNTELLNKDKTREINAIERIPDEINALRKELAAECERAEKAEASNKRYSLYIAIISGIISSVVSVFLSYLVLR